MADEKNISATQKDFHYCPKCERDIQPNNWGSCPVCKTIIVSQFRRYTGATVTLGKIEK